MTRVSGLAELKTFSLDFKSRLSALSRKADKATVVGLSGELGAGKTAFVKAVAEVLGVSDTVTSPTFVIEKIYRLEGQRWQRLIHIDAYRIEKSSELLHLGWQEIVSDPENIIFVEWPERTLDIMPKDSIYIKFVHALGEGSSVRDITYEKN